MSGCGRCEHIEQEFKVLKGSIKKLIVDIREQMNASENPFLNIQQMMPAQPAFFRDEPPEMDEPGNDKDEIETPAHEAENAVPKKKDRGSSTPSPDANDHGTNNHCPLAAGHNRTITRCAMDVDNGGPGDTCPVMQRLHADLGRSAGELCYECMRCGPPSESYATRRVPGCPAEFNDTAPCGRLVGRGHGARFQGQSLPCMRQHVVSGQGKPAYGPGNSPYVQSPCLRCPQQCELQMYGPQPNDSDYHSSHGPCRGDYSPHYHQGYAGQVQYRPGSAEPRHRRDGSCDCDYVPTRNELPREDAREPVTGRPGPWQPPHEAYRSAENSSDYYDEGPEYGYRERSVQGRPARSAGKSHRKSLVHEPDSYIQPEPEPEPVVIDIPGPDSIRKKRKAQARGVPDIVVIDVEPENVVPGSVRTSRRKGL